MAMKLAISNLAWGLTDQDKILSMLSSLGVSGIEVAPTKIASWESITSSMLADFRSHLSDNNLCVSSLQAIFFGKPDAQLLASAEVFALMCEHIDKLADIAAELGGEVAVFGAPKNRIRGDLSPEVAFELAVERFRKLGDICQGRMKIGIEPVPAFYGSDFIQTAAEDLAVVQAIDHPAIGLHLDTGCVFLAGDAIDTAIHNGAKQLIHFHVAEPELASFVSPQAHHESAAKALHTINYDQWISIEMKETSNAVESVIGAVNFTKKIYW